MHSSIYSFLFILSLCIDFTKTRYNFPLSLVSNWLDRNSSYYSENSLKRLFGFQLYLHINSFK